MQNCLLMIYLDMKAAGTMSMYCPLRREIMESALDRGKEETAVTMKVGLYCVTHHLTSLLSDLRSVSERM